MNLNPNIFQNYTNKNKDKKSKNAKSSNNNFRTFLLNK